MTWRLTVRYGHGDEVRDLPDVQALREAVLRLRADPRVHGYQWRRLPDEQPRENCPRCGEAYIPARVHSWPCRCGLTHVTYDCYGCGLVDVDPPRHEGCGAIADDHEYWNTRYTRGRRQPR